MASRKFRASGRLVCMGVPVLMQYQHIHVVQLIPSVQKDLRKAEALASALTSTGQGVIETRLDIKSAYILA